MGGNSGGVIVRHAIKVALSTPIVHGQLPAGMCEDLAPVLAKDAGEWTPADIHVVKQAAGWALDHLQ